jgi:putative SOS response-associated peptidase YedK
MIKQESSPEEIADLMNAVVNEGAYDYLSNLEKKYPKIFKWNPKGHVSQNYMGHVVVYRKEQRLVEPMIYGLTPSFSKQPRWNIEDRKTKRMKQVSTYNARLEEIEQKKSFAPIFETQRCLIPFEEFHEWCEIDGKSVQKAFRQKEDEMMWAVGLYHYWRDPQDKELIVPTFTLLTYEPYQFIIDEGHDRSFIYPQESEIDQILSKERLNKARLLKIAQERYEPEMVAFS